VRGGAVLETKCGIKTKSGHFGESWYRKKAQGPYLNQFENLRDQTPRRTGLFNRLRDALYSQLNHTRGEPRRGRSKHLLNVARGRRAACLFAQTQNNLKEAHEAKALRKKETWGRGSAIFLPIDWR